MNLKPLNLITCTNFKMIILTQMKEAIHPGQWAVSLNIKLASCQILLMKGITTVFASDGKAKFTSSRLPFLLSQTPKTFLYIKPILIHSYKMGMMLFSYLDNVLIPTNSYNQVKKDGQSIAQLLQRLGIILSLENASGRPLKSLHTWFVPQHQGHDFVPALR